MCFKMKLKLLDLCLLFLESVETVVPTVGFNSIKLKHRGFTVIIYDLGGSSQIRGIWHRYFVDVSIYGLKSL
jgi:hypothetical protein